MVAGFLVFLWMIVRVVDVRHREIPVNYSLRGLVEVEELDKSIWLIDR
jgi:hypothetical protein